MIRSGGLGIAGIAVTALPATGGPVPETALSQSVQIATELLPDDEANQYLFPQHAAGAAPALLGFGAAGEGSVEGSGVRARVGASSISFLYVRSVRAATATFTSYPRYQVGWAGNGAGLRFGAAYAWSVRGDRARRTFTPQGSVFDRIESTRSDFETVGHHHAAVGLGWGDGDAAVDVVGEFAWERLDSRFREAEETLSGPYFRSLEETVTHLRGDFLPGGAIRIRLPVASRVRWLGFGTYREISFDETRTIRNEFHDSNGSRTDLTTTTDHHGGSEWSAGATLELGRDWRWIASAFRESRREAWRYRPGRSSAQRVRERVDVLRLGVATVFPLGRATAVRAGWAMTDRRGEETVQSVAYSGSGAPRIHGESDAVGGVSHDFGWGATHTIGFLDLAGSLRHDLALGALFLRLDLRARF